MAKTTLHSFFETRLNKNKRCRFVAGADIACRPLLCACYWQWILQEQRTFRPVMFCI